MVGRLSFRSKPDATTVPELPAITTWARFLLGASCGISLGLRNEKRGLAGVLFGLNVVTFLPMFWFNSYLDANIESYKSLNFAGVAPAFALMLLVWISFFTLENEHAESNLGKVLADAAISVVTAGGGEPVESMSQSGTEDEF
ncbi:hypothetical protein ACHAXR_013429 [Thalassiosira sp. AJA248-18]